MQPEFVGSYTVCVTPFDVTGGVNLGELRSFLDWQLDSGVPGVILLGSTGEFLAVSDDERGDLVAAAVEHIGGRIPVLVGTMNAHTPNAVRYSRQAQDLGADGLMIAPPYYYTPTEDEIVRYYEAISDAVDLPIMLYNNPVTTNVDMSATLVARLAHEFANIRYIKESSQDLERVRQVVDLAGDAMWVYAGEWPVESHMLGAIGYVNPYGNYIPRPSTLMVELARAGRVDEARQIQHLIERIDAIIAEGHPTYGHQCYSKALAAAVGHPMGEVREPLTTFAQLGDEGRGRVDAMLPLIAEVEQLTDDLAAAGRDASG